MDLNISNWKEFKIKDLFNVTLSKGDCKANNLPIGDIQLITSGFTNNGVGAYVASGDGEAELYETNCITVDMFGNTFYRNQPFYSVSHGRVNILLPNIPLTDNVGKFIALIIEQATLQSFSYARMCTSTLLPEVVIKLPIDKSGNLDYQFMEEYINNLDISVRDIPDYYLYDGFNKACWYMDNINQEDFENRYSASLLNEELTIQDRNWKEFRLGDTNYFKIERGASEYIKNMGEGDIPYISTTGKNNGIAAFVDVSNRDGNLISLAYDGTVGSCFYQEKPFFASEKIVTIDLVQCSMNRYIASFLIPILKLESGMYEYGGRKWTVEQQLVNTYIQLPIDDNGEPDYKFMEEYIKSKAFSCNI